VNIFNINEKRERKTELQLPREAIFERKTEWQASATGIIQVTGSINSNNDEDNNNKR
jgi:hypothetical protein